VAVKLAHLGAEKEERLWRRRRRCHAKEAACLVVDAD
jgi:hypothetical protein